MTYTRYEKTHYLPRYNEDGDEYFHVFAKPPKKIPTVLQRPAFMPSYLIRISNMKVVKGSDVHQGYCALSYSWNQSGKITKDETTGKSFRVDQGQHKIIFTKDKKGGKKSGAHKRIKFVKFEELIQEICKDFNVTYIWYDQMCINQNDEEEKRREIRQMHKIYKNAYCTIVLMPELGTDPYRVTDHDFKNDEIMINDYVINDSQWMKRMWTLEEAIMSSKMLIVGRNTHYWAEEIASNINFFFFEKFDYDISLILFHAHTRTTTKEHDHVYALGNLFPDVMEQITIDYNQDVHELILQFYGLLAKKDLNILCFGGYYHYNEISRDSFNNEIISIQRYDLPSWTGFYGEHYDPGSCKTSFKEYTVSGRILSITCHGLTNKQDRTEILNPQYIDCIIPPFPQQELDNKSYWNLVIRVRSPVLMKEKLISLGGYTRETLEFDKYWRIGTSIWKLSFFWPIKNPDLQWMPFSSPISPACFRFFGLTERLEDSAQYVLLPEVLFRNKWREGITGTCPVIKKDGDYYKAIGMCDMSGDGDFFDDFITKEETFEIH